MKESQEEREIIYEDQPGRNNKRLGMILVPVLLVLLFLGYIAYQVFVPTNSDEIILKVNQGDNAPGIARDLHKAGIIRDSNFFLLLARLKGVDRMLKAGTYNFGGRANLLQTVDRLLEGSSIAVNVTLPEGLSLYKTLLKIAHSGIMPYDSLYAAATEPGLVERLTGRSLPSLEGFLYPETYRFELGMTAEDILEIQVAEFFKRMASAEIDARADSTFYDKLILASIVEAETIYEDERPTVAGVYLNRLKKNMRLESCPTVDYFLEKEGIHREILLTRDINTPSPYNTYLNAGLPPTPICNPSLSSIQAVYQPEQHNYLFFQADRQGRNVFSVTFAEHRRKMAQLPRRFE